MVSKWIRVSLLFFIVAGILGVFLRYQIAVPIPGINYKYMLHTHSHVAFMGWVFNALFAATIYLFLPQKEHAHYNHMFILFQMTVLGMLFTFPWQGYGLYSIIFSTLHIFISYWFAFKFYIDTRKRSFSGKIPVSLKFIYWALIFMALSSVGPYALGYIMAQEGQPNHWYRLAIYFYLHFQYNGWFTFAVLGLFSKWIENSGISHLTRKMRLVLWLMVLGCFPTFALSALWLEPPAWVYITGFIGAFLQLIALVVGWQIFDQVKPALVKGLGSGLRMIFGLALLAFALKILMQLGSAFPYFAELAFRFKNLTIGFLHLVFLGFISLSLLGWIFQKGFLILKGNVVMAGTLCFITGILMSELMLFLQPLLVILGIGLIPYYLQLLLIISVLIPAGLILIWIGQNVIKKASYHSQI